MTRVMALGASDHGGSILSAHLSCYHLFFFNDTATTEIYTLSLHDALPISWEDLGVFANSAPLLVRVGSDALALFVVDRKSTRLNSSHITISYAVFCLKKKKKNYNRASRLI